MSFPLPPWAQQLPAEPAPPAWVRLGLSPRLAALAELIPAGARVADVGTDHARLPEALLASGRVARAIGTDRAASPLEAARARLIGRTAEARPIGRTAEARPIGRTAEARPLGRTAEARPLGRTAEARPLGRAAQPELRLGEGLEPLRPGEVDTVVMAGFGGRRMRAVLEPADLVALGVLRVVVQPTAGLPGLRTWLAGQGFVLVEERIVREGDRGFISSAWLRGDRPTKLAPFAALVGGLDPTDPLVAAWLEAQRDHLRRQGERAADLHAAVTAWLEARRP